VSTRVVSWNEAADSHESVASDADEADPAAWLSSIHGSYDETSAFSTAPAESAVAVLEDAPAEQAT